MSAVEEKKNNHDDNPYVDKTLLSNLSNFTQEKNKEFVLNHATNNGNGNIPTPPEIIEYETKYDETDKKIEQYLRSKYKNNINSFTFFPDDILVRFVMGYKHLGNGDYNKRLKETDILFKKYIDFHTQTDYDNILTKLSQKEISELVSTSFIYGNDKYGHPVVYDNGIRYRKNGDLSIFKKGGQKTIDLFIACLLRKLHDTKIENTKRLKLNDKKIGIYQHIAVCDITKFSAKKFLKERKVNEYMVKRSAELSPEMLHKVFIINAPWIFVKVWNIFKHFVHPITVQKTVILGNDYIKQLTQEIDLSNIPQQYGGTGKNFPNQFI